MCSPFRRSTGGGTSREALVVSTGASCRCPGRKGSPCEPKVVDLACLADLGRSSISVADRWAVRWKRPSRACRPAELQGILEASEADDEDIRVRPDAAVHAIAPSGSRGSCEVNCCAERAASTDDASGRRRPDHRAAASGASACEDGGLLRDQRSARRPSWVGPQTATTVPASAACAPCGEPFLPTSTSGTSGLGFRHRSPTRVTLHRPPVAAVKIPWSDAVACRGREAVVATVPRPALRRSRRCR